MIRLNAWRYAIILSLGILTQLSAQIETGTYKGHLQIPSGTLDVVLLVEKPTDWKVTFQVPQQTAQGFPASDLAISSDSITFKVSGIPGNVHYAGRIESPTSISGTFYQGPAALPLSLTLEGTKASQIDTTGWHHFIDSVRNLFEVPGIGVAIYYDGKVLLSDGFGFQDQEKKIPATAQTIFGIGSTTKAFTAMGNAMLVDDGKLEWTKPVHEYLPDFAMHDAFASQEMTPEDLLCHRSGLPRHDLLWYGSNWTRKELFDRLKFLEPNEPFRTTFQYQNLMFMTAGILTEHLSGMSWEDFTRTRILTPLDMQATSFSTSEMTGNNRASKPYRWTKSGVIEIPYRNIDAIGPAGSINSTAEDMVKWVAFNLNKGKVGDHQLLDPSQIEYIQKPHMSGAGIFAKPGTSEGFYGLGWSILYYHNLKIVSHGGNIDGFTAHVHLVPEKGFGMVVLANMNGTPLSAALSFAFMDKVLGVDGTNWIQTGHERWLQVTDRGPKEEDKEKEEKEKEEAKPFIPVRPLSAYAGTFEHPAYGKFTVTLDRDTLRASFNFMKLSLSAVDVDLFQGIVPELGDEGFKIKFDAGMSNYIDRIQVPLEPAVDPIVFERIASDLWKRSDYLKQFVGDYDVNGLKIVIKLEGDQLKMTPAGQPTFALQPILENQFKVPDLPGFSVSFKGTDHDVIVLHQPNGEFEGKRSKE